MSLASNLRPFDASVDAIRNPVKMGGSRGDAVDGVLVRCDQDPANFWEVNTGEIRSATVILRRQDMSYPGGLSTGEDCGGFAPGTTSTTWWEYRDIYVK